jgi:phage baseplate assembly protein W
MPDASFVEFRAVAGRQMLAQALWRRWITTRGDLLDDPDYGTNLVDYINEDIDVGTVSKIVAAAVAEAMKDERVVKVKGTGRFDETERGTLYLEFTIFDGDGPFTLTLAVTDVTVSLLTVNP